MKIKLSELRKLIRESIVEQGWPPGRWLPDSGESLGDEDVERMSIGGLGEENSDEDEAL